MEAVGQLTGGIAHDFNNLLTGITGALDLIRRRISAGRTDEIERFMDAAYASVQRGAALTHRLLAFARRQSLDIKPHDVNLLVAGLEDLLRRTIGDDIAFETVLKPNLWPAMTDANQLENALLNLAINARDAMPEGGRLTIETANTRLEESGERLTDHVDPGDYVRVAVTDTGHGMPADVIAKAFDPFFTTKPVGQGTGLGLSMIYGFVKQSGGHVRIDSEVARGTTVTIYLRRAQPVEEHGRLAPEAAALCGKGETVLVVEDDATVRLLVTEVLREFGYRYIEAPDADTALLLLQADQTIDLLVTDVSLPHMNGRQLAEVARQHRPHLKVLFITGYAAAAASRGDFLRPGMEMITKPFALDALGAKLRVLIEGREPPVKT
jgi:CheY-like chemotaxis protein